MRPAPNLNDPAERQAYARELQRVVPLARTIGVGLAVAGAVVAIVRGYVIPEVPAWAPLALVGTGLAVMVYGMVTRSRYHAKRMRGEG